MQKFDQFLLFKNSIEDYSKEKLEYLQFSKPYAKHFPSGIT